MRWQTGFLSFILENKSMRGSNNNVMIALVSNATVSSIQAGMTVKKRSMQIEMFWFVESNSKQVRLIYGMR